MAKNKYTLPVVKSLAEIGFQFEYAKLNDVIPYIKNFIVENYKLLVSHYHPDKHFKDDEGNDQIISWDNPARTEDELLDEKEEKLIEKILRIEKGNIKLSDYALLVHPKYRMDQNVLLKALNRKLRSIYGATGNLVFRYHIWELDFFESARECLFHHILDDLISAILSEGKIQPIELNPEYKTYLGKKEKADEYKYSNKDDNNPTTKLFTVSKYMEAEKVLMNISDEIFSTNLTLEKNARIVMRRALGGKPILTNIENKQKTISYYLRLQSKSVTAAKDCSKSNKGIQEKKRKAVIDTYLADPKKSIRRILNELPPGIDVSRKTASKYIIDYKMGKNI